MRKKIIFTGGGTGGHVFPGLALLPQLSKFFGAEAFGDKGEGLDANGLPEEIREIFGWIGTKAGPESEYVSRYGIAFFGVQGGKLRRYFSFKNFVDPFRVIIGYLQSLVVLARNRPEVLVSIGGFASIPAVCAAATLRIPIVSVSCDFSFGLATKIAAAFSSVLLCAYPETAARSLASPLYQKLFALTRHSRVRMQKKILAKDWSAERARTLHYSCEDINAWIRYTGVPIRESAYMGDARRVAQEYGLGKSARLILFLGGSKGAKQINDIATGLLAHLSEDVCVVHQTGSAENMASITGAESDSEGVVATEDTITSTASRETNNKEKLISSYSPMTLERQIKCRYFAKEFFSQDYAHLLARADVVVARAGTSTVWELVANEIPSILIPLSAQSSRGDQVENADYFASRGMLVNLGTSPSQETLHGAIEGLLYNKELCASYVQKCKEFDAKKSVDRIVAYIEIFCEKINSK